MMDRKGDTWDLSYQLYYVIAIIIVTGLIFIFFFSISNFQQRLSEIPNVIQAEITSMRFANNPDCFAYADEAGKVYSGIVDANKFTKKSLDSCYTSSNEKGLSTLNFAVKLVSSGEELKSNNYFHPADFHVYKEILLYKEGKLSKDQLDISVREATG